jgi:hypothetical protein
LVTAGVVAGAIAVNTLVSPNVGTALAVIYVAHWLVQGAAMAGAAWWLGWLDDEPRPTPVSLLKD